MYEHGRGVEPDPVFAYAWLSMAAIDIDAAEDQLEALEEKMNEKQIEAGKQMQQELQKKIEGPNSGPSPDPFMNLGAALTSILGSRGDR